MKTNEIKINIEAREAGYKAAEDRADAGEEIADVNSDIKEVSNIQLVETKIAKNLTAPTAIYIPLTI